MRRYRRFERQRSVFEVDRKERAKHAFKNDANRMFCKAGCARTPMNPVTETTHRLSETNLCFARFSSLFVALS